MEAGQIPMKSSGGNKPQLFLSRAWKEVLSIGKLPAVSLRASLAKLDQILKERFVSSLNVEK